MIRESVVILIIDLHPYGVVENKGTSIRHHNVITRGSSRYKAIRTVSRETGTSCNVRTSRVIDSFVTVTSCFICNDGELVSNVSADQSTSCMSHGKQYSRLVAILLVAHLLINYKTLGPINKWDLKGTNGILKKLKLKCIVRFLTLLSPNSHSAAVLLQPTSTRGGCHR